MDTISLCDSLNRNVSVWRVSMSRGILVQIYKTFICFHCSSGMMHLWSYLGPSERTRLCTLIVPKANPHLHQVLSARSSISLGDAPLVSAPSGSREVGMLIFRDVYAQISNLWDLWDVWFCLMSMENNSDVFKIYSATRQLSIMR